MNPLAISVTFVICTILLSYLKNFLFDQQQPPKQIPKFNKIFLLTNNEVTQGPKNYRSLYQAYKRQQIPDAIKISDSIPNRNNFNQSILTHSIWNQEKSIMCGSGYIVMLVEGIEGLPVTQGQHYDQGLQGKNGGYEGGYVNGQIKGDGEWVTIVEVYALPILNYVGGVTIKGKVELPKNCKKISTDKYWIVVTGTKQMSSIQIANNSITHFQFTMHKSSNHIQIFDFESGWVAYTTKQKPWVVHLQKIEPPFSKTKHPPKQINLLQNQPFPGKQILNIRAIMLASLCRNRANCLEHEHEHEHEYGQGQGYKLHVKIVYYNHKQDRKERKISVAVYDVNQQNKGMDEYVGGKDLYVSQFFNLDNLQVQCDQFYNQKTNKYDASCVLHKNNQELAHFMTISVNQHQQQNKPLNKQSTQIKNKEQSMSEEERQQAINDDNWFPDEIIQLKLQQQQQQWYYYFLSKQQQEEQDSPYVFQQQTSQPSEFPSSDPKSPLKVTHIVLMLPSNSPVSPKLLNPRPPTPLLLHSNPSKHSHKLLFFHLPTSYTPSSPGLVKLLDFSSSSNTQSHSVFVLTPVGNNEDKYIRDIVWIREQGQALGEGEADGQQAEGSEGGDIVIVVWSTAVQVYEIVWEVVDADGIAVIVIIPFIQLFATVYCLLRIIWV